MSVITLTTDFGTGNPIIGQMYGVIRSIAPQASIVDLSHDIPRGNGQAVQIILEDSAAYFPDGTIHLAVLSGSETVDAAEPAHRPLAANVGKQRFVGPDNGLITPLLERAEANRGTVEIYHANQTQYWRAAEEANAPGIDVYAPLAAHLALGVPLPSLGERINDPLRSRLPDPEMVGAGWRGQILLIDYFGNLLANLKAFHLEGMGPLRTLVGGTSIEGLSRTFGDAQPGDLIAIIDSSNRLSVSVVNGSAAERLGVRPGDPIEVQSIPKP